MNAIRWLVLVCSVLLAGGCARMSAQDPAGAYGPVNAVAAEGHDSLLLGGADVVAYFTEGRYQPGLAEYATRHEGVTLYFASADHKALFEADPARYLPEFGGYCTNGIVYGIPWGGDADTWKIIDGRLYIFGGQASRDAFELDEQGNLALAQAYWRDEIAGSNPFVQRAWRLLFRVPHYRSGEELAAAVEQARATP